MTHQVHRPHPQRHALPESQPAEPEDQDHRPVLRLRARYVRQCLQLRQGEEPWCCGGNRGSDTPTRGLWAIR